MTLGIERRIEWKLDEMGLMTVMKGFKDCFHITRVPPWAEDVWRARSWSKRSLELRDSVYWGRMKGGVQGGGIDDFYIFLKI